MKTEDQVQLAFDVLSCRMVEEEDRMSTPQYTMLCAMMVALAWVSEMDEGIYLQVLLDGQPFALNVTEQRVEAFRTAMKESDASRN